jgi:hypothetical protein
LRRGQRRNGNASLGCGRHVNVDRIGAGGGGGEGRALEYLGPDQVVRLHDQDVRALGLDAFAEPG